MQYMSIYARETPNINNMKEKRMIGPIISACFSVLIAVSKTILVWAGLLGSFTVANDIAIKVEAVEDPSLPAFNFLGKEISIEILAGIKVFALLLFGFIVLPTILFLI